MSEVPLSPLATLIMGKLAALKTTHSVRLTSDQYDPNNFGGATDLQILVDDLRLEISARDPKLQYEIELGCERELLKSWRASYAKNYLARLNTVEIDPPPGLIDWIIENWDGIYRLICNPTPSERMKFEAFSKALDEKRHAKMIEAFGQ